jgi:prephenate dehydrogenase
MRLFNKVAIVGTGLIGGSLALAIKKKRLANQVIGISRHKKNLIIAKKTGAIDRGSQQLGIIKDVDLLVLATPVNKIITLAPRVARIIKKDCLVTDVGSTKEEIVSCLEKIFPKYIGSHPLAGSEKRGIVNAQPNIFQDSLCLLTPTRNTDEHTLKKIKMLWNNLGAKIVLLSPKEHDKILSLTSHLPHMIAFSLINSVPKSYLRFSSGGLKDTTRIAASESELWAGIALSNRRNILRAMDFFQASLLKIKSALQRKDAKQLSKILKEAKEKREKLG